MKKSLLWLALLPLFASCSKTLPEQIAEAQAYQAQGEFGKAVIALRNVVKAQPNDGENHVLLAKALIAVGESAQAEEEIKKAQVLEVPNARLNSLRATVLTDQEKFKELLDEFGGQTQKVSAPVTKGGGRTQAQVSRDNRAAASDERAQRKGARVRLDGIVSLDNILESDEQSFAAVDAPIDPERALIRGRALLSLGQVDQARREFNLALDGKPFEGQLGLAQAAAAAGDPSTAVTKQRELQEQFGDRAEVWILRGDLERAGSNDEAAVASYTKALKLEPFSVPAHLGGALAYLASGKIAKARTEVDAVLKSAPANAQGNFVKAVLALRERKYDETRDALQKVSRQIPTHAPSLLIRASLLYETGDLDGAEGVLGAYLTRYPGHVHARKMLAATLLRKEQPRYALDVLEPLLPHITNDAELLSLAGQASLQAGQLARARGYLEKAVALQPTNATMRANLGVSRLIGGERAKAVGDLESAIALNSEDTRAEGFLIMALIAENQTQRAMQIAVALQKKEPDKSLGDLLRGQVQLAQNERAAARASFERALKKQPGLFPAAAALAQLDLKEGKPESARARMDELLSHDKKNVDAMLALAKFEFDAGKRDAADHWVQKAQEMNSKAMGVYVLQVQMKLRAGDFKQALAAAQEARRTNPNSGKAIELVGGAQLASGDAASAAATFESLARLQPKALQPRLLLADALSTMGKQPEALQEAQKALQMNPSSLDARLSVGSIQLRSGQFKAALEVAREMQKERSPLGYVLEGDVQLAQKDFAHAVEAYRKADGLQSSGLLRVRAHAAESMLPGSKTSIAPLEEWVRQHPEDVDTRLYLGDVYAKSGGLKPAIEIYEALLKVNPKDFRVMNNLASALQEVNDPRFLDYAQQAFQLQPNSAAVADTLGWALLARGNIDSSVTMLSKAVDLDPRNTEFRFHLVKALIKANNNGRARRELKLLVDAREFSQAAAAREILRSLPP